MTATGPGKHTPHLLGEALSWHVCYLHEGTMGPGWGSHPNRSAGLSFAAAGPGPAAGLSCEAAGPGRWPGGQRSRRRWASAGLAA